MSGELIGGRFRLVEELASGGFGTVWRAFDETLGIEVALKQVKLDPTVTGKEREKAVSRAEHEARNAARLRDHPNIVTVYDVVSQDGSPWLVMRLVKGRSVQQELEACGRLHPDEVGKVAAGVLNALVAAHTAGIIHRDVKPANIMLGDDGTVLLTDFGIAKHHTDTTQTTRGMLIGSLPYMAPERFDDKDLPAGDLWSLGTTLYEMCEGAPAFAGTTPVAIISAVTMKEPDPPIHAGRLTPLITALLEKDPEKRPDTAGALKILEGKKPPKTLVAKTVTNEAVTKPLKPRRSRAVAVVMSVVAAAAAVVAGLALAGTFSHKPSTPPPATTPTSDAAALAGTPVIGSDGKCLDVRGNDTGVNHTPIQLYDCQPYAFDQHWTHNANGSLETLTRCMDASDAGTTNGTLIQLFKCNGTGAQVWVQTADGELLNPASGRCLTDPGGQPVVGTQLVLWDCGTAPGDAQKFQLSAPQPQSPAPTTTQPLLAATTTTNPPAPTTTTTTTTQPTPTCLSFCNVAHFVASAGGSASGVTWNPVCTANSCGISDTFVNVGGAAGNAAVTFNVTKEGVAGAPIVGHCTTIIPVTQPNETSTAGCTVVWSPAGQVYSSDPVIDNPPDNS